MPEDGFVARKPSALDFTEVAAMPLAGVAAQVAVDAVEPHEDDTVLVVGADGGVGRNAVQLAVKRRAKVIATVKPNDELVLCWPRLSSHPRSSLTRWLARIRPGPGASCRYGCLVVLRAPVSRMSLCRRPVRPLRCRFRDAQTVFEHDPGVSIGAGVFPVCCVSD